MGALPLLFVALDLEDHRARRALARRLHAEVPGPGYGFKVNLDAACRLAPGRPALYEQLEELAELGRPLFLDLKMWNGGRTMEAIAEGLAEHPELRVEVVDVYPHAGPTFVRRVAAALEGSATKLFGLTVLTHYDDAYCRELYGKGLDATVRFLAARNLEAGCRGVILPATQLEAVAGLGCEALCPGIRPSWDRHPEANAQVQVATPAAAVKGGARYLVMGSPITKAEAPGEALQRVLWEIKGAA